MKNLQKRQKFNQKLEKKHFLGLFFEVCSILATKQRPKLKKCEYHEVFHFFWHPAWPHGHESSRDITVYTLCLEIWQQWYPMIFFPVLQNKLMSRVSFIDLKVIKGVFITLFSQNYMNSCINLKFFGGLCATISFDYSHWRDFFIWSRSLLSHLHFPDGFSFHGHFSLFAAKFCLMFQVVLVLAMMKVRLVHQW